jgi:hypothetical protein
MQFMNNEQLFFEWIEKIEACKDSEPDEDYLFGNDPLQDRKQFNRVEVSEYFKVRLWHPMLRLLKSLLNL